jgi:hypothetical protein
MNRKPVKSGEGWLLTRSGKRRVMSLTELKRYGESVAAQKYPSHFWSPVIFESDTYFRLSFGSQPRG